VLVASPLGLKTALDKEGATFLSSVEVLVLERAHCLLQQNWEHVHTLLQSLNLMCEYDSMQNPID
jgi:hypothetical protein